MGNQFLDEDDRLQRQAPKRTTAPQGDDQADEHQDATMREAGRDYTRQLAGGESQDLVSRTPAGTPAGVDQGRLLQQSFVRGRADGAELADQWRVEAEQSQAEGEDPNAAPAPVVAEKGAEMQRLDALGPEPAAPVDQKGADPVGGGAMGPEQKGQKAPGQKGPEQKGPEQKGPEQKGPEVEAGGPGGGAPVGPPAPAPMCTYDQLVLEEVMAANQTEAHDASATATGPVVEQGATSGAKESKGFGASMVSALSQAVLGPISGDWRKGKAEQFDKIWGEKSIYGEGAIANLQKTLATVRMVVDSVGSIASTVGLWASLLSLVGLIPGLQPIGAFLAAVGEVCTVVGIACAAINIALSALNMVISLIRLLYEKIAGVESGAQYGAMFVDDLFNIGASVVSIGLSSAGGTVRAGMKEAGKAGAKGLMQSVRKPEFWKGFGNQFKDSLSRNLVRTGLSSPIKTVAKLGGKRVASATSNLLAHGATKAGAGTMGSFRDMWRTIHNDQAQRWAGTAVNRGLMQKGGASEALAKAPKESVTDEMLGAWREENRQVREIVNTQFEATDSVVVKPQGGGMPYREYSGHVSATGETTQAAADRLQKMVPAAQPTIAAGPGATHGAEAVTESVNVVKHGAGKAIGDALVQGGRLDAATSDVAGNAYSRWIRSGMRQTIKEGAEKPAKRALTPDYSSGQDEQQTQPSPAPAPGTQPPPPPAPSPAPAPAPTSLPAALSALDGGSGGGGGDVSASVTARSETAGQSVAANIFAPETFSGPDTALPPEKGPVAMEAIAQVKAQREVLLEMQKGLEGRRGEAKVAIVEAKETSALGGKWAEFGKGVQTDAAGMKQKYAQKGTELGQDAVKAGEGATKAEEVQGKATGMSEKAEGTQGKGNVQPASFPQNPSVWQRVKRFFLEGVVGRFNAAMDRGKQILTGIITKAVMGAMNMDGFKAKVVEGKEKAVKGQQEMKTSEDRMSKGEQKAAEIQKEGTSIKADADSKYAESVQVDAEYGQREAEVAQQLAALDAREAALTAKAEEFKGAYRQPIDATNAEIQKANAGVGLEERSSATVDADVQAIQESVTEVQQASQRALSEVRGALARVSGAARQDVDAAAQGKGGQVEQTGSSLAQRHTQIEAARAARVNGIAAEAQGMAGQQPTPERTKRLGELHRQLAQEARGVEQTKQSILATARQEYGQLLEDLTSATATQTRK